MDPSGGKESPGPPPPSPNRALGSDGLPEFEQYPGVVELSAGHVRALFPEYTAPPPPLSALCHTVNAVLTLNSATPRLSFADLARDPQYALGGSQYDPERAIVSSIAVRGKNPSRDVTVGFRSSIISERVPRTNLSPLLARALDAQQSFVHALKPDTGEGRWRQVLAPGQYTTAQMAVATGRLDDRVVHQGVVFHGVRAYVPTAHVLVYFLRQNRLRLQWRPDSDGEAVLLSVPRPMYDSLVEATLQEVRARVPYTNMLEATMEMAAMPPITMEMASAPPGGNGVLQPGTEMPVLISYVLFPRDTQGHMPTLEESPAAT